MCVERFLGWDLIIWQLAQNRKTTFRSSFRIFIDFFFSFPIKLTVIQEGKTGQNMRQQPKFIFLQVEKHYQWLVLIPPAQKYLVSLLPRTKCEQQEIGIGLAAKLLHKTKAHPRDRPTCSISVLDPSRRKRARYEVIPTAKLRKKKTLLKAELKWSPSWWATAVDVGPGGAAQGSYRHSCPQGPTTNTKGYCKVTVGFCTSLIGPPAHKLQSSPSYWGESAVRFVLNTLIS